jgi:hypothetical protein
MSQFTTVETRFCDLQALLRTLRKMGLKPEVGKDLHLYGYQGDRRPQTADVVVRRKQLGPLSNDIGFKKVGKHYQMIISQYDAAVGALGGQKGQALQTHPSESAPGLKQLRAGRGAAVGSSASPSRAEREQRLQARLAQAVAQSQTVGAVEPTKGVPAVLQGLQQQYALEKIRSEAERAGHKIVQAQKLPSGEVKVVVRLGGVR